MSITSRMMQSAAAGLPGDEWTLNDVKKPFSPLGQVQVGTGFGNPNQQFFWKSDGTSFFQVNGSAVYERVGSSAWETYPATTVASANILQDSYMQGLAFKPDGTKMYTTGYANTKVYEYDLGTAWDLTTLSFNQDLSLGFATELLPAISFTSDGLTMFVSRKNDGVYTYSLSTAWDISSASSGTLQSFSLMKGFTFNPTGTQFFYCDGSDVLSYALGTAWDLSTASASGQPVLSDELWYRNGEFGFTDNFRELQYPVFNDDGEKLFLLVDDRRNGGTEGFYNYNLSSAYDLSTASRQLSASNYYQWPNAFYGTYLGKGGLCFNPRGTSMYVADSYTSTVKQYDLSAGYDISTASYASQITSAHDADVAISEDGTLFFASDGSSVQTYALGTAFDLSTASLDSTTTLSPTVNAIGIAFSDDGLKFFVSSTGVIYQWTLATAYDLSTASYDTNTGSLGTGAFYSLRFDSSGKKILLLQRPSSLSQTLRQYSLSTAWDITTISFVGFLEVNIDTGGYRRNGPYGMGISPDGSYLYLPMRGQDALLQYNLK